MRKVPSSKFQVPSSKGARTFGLSWNLELGTSSPDFLNGPAAIPLHRVGHWRLKHLQFFGRTPADVVVLFGCAANVGGILWSRPVDQTDVFVRVGDTMNVEKPRRDQGAGAGTGRGRTFAEQ